VLWIVYIFEPLLAVVDFTNMVYTQLLHSQIPKGQKTVVQSSIYFCNFGSEHVKAACKMLVKSTLTYFTMLSKFATISKDRDPELLLLVFHSKMLTYSKNDEKR